MEFKYLRINFSVNSHLPTVLALIIPQNKPIKYSLRMNKIFVTTLLLFFFSLDSKLLSSGNGKDYSLGKYSQTLLKVDGIQGNILKVASGYLHVVVLMENFNIYVFGMNTLGSLGTGDSIHRYKPVLLNETNVVDVVAGRGFSILLKNDSVSTTGWNSVTFFFLTSFVR
jgi:alpha-tubulin suppressor-like RCC1 family protein